MMRPPRGSCRRITRNASLAQRKAPVRLTATMAFHSCRVISSGSLDAENIPALLNSRSTRPKLVVARSNRSTTDDSSVTSVGTGSSSPGNPAPWSATSCSADSRRPANATRHPPAARASAVAAPMPLPAPVMTATLSDGGCSSSGCTSRACHGRVVRAACCWRTSLARYGTDCCVAPDRVPARACPGAHLPGQGVPHRLHHAGRLEARRDREACRGTGTLTELPGIGPKTSTVVDAGPRRCGPRLPGRPGGRLRARWSQGGEEIRAALRGDLHSHSDWSDGGSPIQEMAVTAMELGHEYQALTDHSPRLTVANGLTVERLRKQLAHRRHPEQAPRRLPTAVRHRVRHQRGRHPGPDRRDARAGSTSSSPPCIPSCGPIRAR